MSNQTPKFGMQGRAIPSDLAGDYNALVFIVKQILNRANISAVCEVKAVRGGGVGQQGYVDLQPLLNQIDGYGDSIPPGILHNVPFFRLQSGSSAIIIDPQVGDVGLAVFSDRDISAIKFQYNNGTMSSVLSNGANPNSRRRFDVADGLFFGGFFNGTPTQYIQFQSNKILISSPSNVVINSPVEIDITSPLINLSGWAGMIAAFGSSTPPQGWLVCPTAQTLVSLATYPRLSVLGTLWGGDGVSTVGLPFFPAGYTLLANNGTVGAQGHGKVKDHYHLWGTANNVGYSIPIGVQSVYPYGASIATSTPQSPEGGPDNLAAGSNVLMCVKY